MTDTLFDGYDPEPQPHKDPDLSPDRRLTLRQLGEIRKAVHPLTHGPLHGQADRNATKDDGPRRPFTCGTCKFRESFLWHNKTFPKCTAHNRVFLKHSTQTDVRAWWPACPVYLPAGSWSSTNSGEV